MSLVSDEMMNMMNMMNMMTGMMKESQVREDGSEE